MENIHDAVFATDLALTITAWNKAAEKLYGWKAEEAIGKTANRLLNSEFSPEESQSIVRQLEQAGFFIGEAVHHARDGRRIIVESHTVLHRGPDGQPAGFISSNQDITERKHTEERLRESETKFMTIFEKVPVAITLNRLSDARIVDVNEAFEKLFGYSKEEVIGRTSLEVGFASDPRVREQVFSQFKQKGFVHQVEIAYRTKTGNPIVIRGNIDPVTINGETFILNAFENITEVKQAEVALQEEKENYRRIVETAYEGILIADPSGIVSYVNPYMAELLGYSIQELVGKPGISLVDPTSYRLVHEKTENRKQGLQDTYEIKFLRKDGADLWALASGSPIRNSQGEHIGNLGMYIDITERKQAEKSLRKSESKFMAIFQKAPMAIALSSLANGELVDVNEAFEQIFGFKKGEAIGRTSLELGIAPEAQAREQLLTQLKQSGFAHQIELFYRNKTGDTIALFGNIDQVTIGTEKYFLSTFENVTERKQAEEALRISEYKFSILFTEASLPAVLSRLSDHVYVDVNDAWVQLFGFTKEEVRWKDLCRAWHPTE